MDADFLDLLPHSVQISTRTGHSAYGTATWASASTYRARVVTKPGFVRTSQGEVVEARTVVWVYSTKSTFTVSDKVTLPDASTPPIVLVETYADEDGAYHSKLTCGF